MLVLLHPERLQHHIRRRQLFIHRGHACDDGLGSPWLSLRLHAPHALPCRAGKALLFGDPVSAAEAQAATGGYALAPGSGYTSAASSSPAAAAKASAAIAGWMSWVKHSVLAASTQDKSEDALDDEERQLRQVRARMHAHLHDAHLHGLAFSSCPHR